MESICNLSTPIKAQELALYTAETIDQLEWPETEEGLHAKKYFVPLVKDGINHYVKNIRGSLVILKYKENAIPLLLVEDEFENSYVCSPYGHYILLGLEYLHLMNNRLLRAGAANSLKGIGKILKQGKINNILYINHWMFATDLHSREIGEEDLRKIVNFLSENYPRHAIAVRSINSKNNPELKQHLGNIRFSFLLSRQIYLTDTNDEAIFQTRILKSDLKLLRECDYEIVGNDDLQEHEHERILQLYNLLSIEQHSALNPQLNLNFVRLLIEDKLLQIKALKKNGVIEGIVGYLERSQTLFCPFIGFDKAHPDKSKLYRLLSTLLLLEARKKKCLMHQSAGASFYKTVRRAVSYQEYLAVYTRHLPFKQKVAWGLLQGMINLTAAPLMKKY
jgi:hypothetical protein